MAVVAVIPETFQFTYFDAPTIQLLGERVAGLVGLDCDVTITVDDATPAIETTLVRWDPDIAIEVCGGALEHRKQIRRLGNDETLEVLGRLLFRAKDRRDPAFADAPDEAAVDVRAHACWEVWAVGRGVRAGLPGSASRRRYQLRNRLGFTDAVDATFDRLWTADTLTWSDMADLSAAAATT